MTPLLAGLAAALALMTAVWALSLARRDASIVDAFWGPAFAVMAWLYLALAEAPTRRAWIAVGLVTLWAARLSAHIAWRARGRGEDYRYREMRERHGARFPLVSLATVFLLQGTIAWIVALPLARAIGAPAPRDLGGLDAAGLALFAVGFLFESVADWQLARFRARAENRGRLLASGLWRYSRHPNYFGDALLWWGFGLLALATPGSWWTLVGPALMTFLLLRVSGVSLLERKLIASKPGYREYVERTSAFVPWPPRF